MRLAIISAPLKFASSCRTLAWPGLNQYRHYTLAENDVERTSADAAAVTSGAENATDSNEKMINVAVIGAPNAGKSSFINKFIDRKVCPTSQKVHTTRDYSRSIINKKESQMILFDTPGLVDSQEIKKYKLNSRFISSCRHSIQHANLIAVVHDVSRTHTRNALHPTVIETLKEYNETPSILVLNKLDLLRSKRILLDLVKVLTENTLAPRERRYRPWEGAEHEFIKDMSRPVKYKNEKSVGWPHFSEVFMVSSLSGDGINHVRKYIQSQSVIKPWEFRVGEYTDRTSEQLVIDNVRAVLLDYLPQEIPYNLTVEMEYFDKKKDRIFASVNVVCPSQRIEKLVCGGKNNRMQQIAETVTSELIRLYRFNCAVVINVKSPESGKPKSQNRKS